jgi:vanillate O-demethylase ferredoxin subunit
VELVVAAKTLVAADTVRIELARADAQSLPSFEPGAHLELGFAGLRRRYSITSSPLALDHYEICVLRADPSRGGSTYLHDRLEVGERVVGTGPVNAFPLRVDADHSVFVAGGIGITPFLSMMQVLHDASRSFELHYAARSRDRFVTVPEYGGIHRYSDSPRMDVAEVLEGVPAAAELYVCGPRSLIEAVRGSAQERGWPEQRVRFESFGAARRPADAPVSVHLAMSGTTIEVPPDRTILDSLLEHGIWAAYECRRGECASCYTEVLAGEPDHRDLCLTSEQQARGMCTCISWARTRELTLLL